MNSPWRQRRRGKLPVVGATAEENNMRGILLWAIGLPIPVIILLYLFHVI